MAPALNRLVAARHDHHSQVVSEGLLRVLIEPWLVQALQGWRLGASELVAGSSVAPCGPVWPWLRMQREISELQAWKTQS